LLLEELVVTSGLKNYHLVLTGGLYDIQFYKLDENGNELTYKDGSVKLFTTRHDFPHHLIAELPDHEDLEEIKND